MGFPTLTTLHMEDDVDSVKRFSSTIAHMAPFNFNGKEIIAKLKKYLYNSVCTIIY